MTRPIAFSLASISLLLTVILACAVPAPGVAQGTLPTATSEEDAFFANNETIYFWRIVDSQSGIYYSRQGQDPQVFAPLSGTRCTGCHAVSSTSGLIASVMDTGTGQIVVYDLVTEEGIPIPEANGSYLSWSPNGRELAISYLDQDIYIINLDEGTLTPLAGASSSSVIETMPAWSPDGTEITFVRSTESTDGFSLNGNSELAVVPAQGGQAMLYSGVPVGQNYYPAYSPDGRWLAFTHHNVASEDSYSSDAADIYLLPLDGGEAFPLNINSGLSDSWPSWSGDGSWLAFNTKRDGQYDILVTQIDASGRASDPIGFPGANTTNYEHLPAWGLSPQGILTQTLAPTLENTATSTATRPAPTHTPTATAQPTLTPSPTLAPTATTTPTPMFGSPIAQVCLGPLSLPCAWLGLPWWVCLLWLLSLLLLLFVLWRWRKADREVKRRTPPPLAGFAALPPTTIPPLPGEPVPGKLSPRPAVAQRPTPPSLIIGVGPGGQGALKAIQDTLEDSYGEIPAPVHLLEVTTGPTHPEDNPDRLVIPSDQINQRLEALSAAGRQMPAWYPEAKTQRAGSLTQRGTQRLALWLHTQETRAWLERAIKETVGGGDHVDVYLVTAPGEAEAALLVDLINLLHQQAGELSVSVAVHGFCILDAPKDLPAEQTASFQQNAFAFWRELDRFQLAFDAPYPFDYPDGSALRRGKLIDRLYLLSSVGMQYTYSLTDLQHAIADALLCILDQFTRPPWLETLRPIDSRLHALQNTLNQPLYSSLGTFTYILPIETLVKLAAVQFANSLMIAQAAPKSVEMREEALRCLEQVRLTSGVANTQLIQEIAQRARAGTDASVISGLGIKVADFMAPDREKSASLQALKTIYTLFEDYIKRAIPNSREYKAPGYSGRYRDDLPRFFGAVDGVEKQLTELNGFLEQSVAHHNKIFAHMLQEKVASADVFSQLLTETIPCVLSGTQIRSAGRVVAFIEALQELIRPQLASIEATAKKFEQESIERERDADKAKEVLQANAETSKEKQPSKWEALIKIIAIITNEGFWGVLSLLFPAFALWFAVPAVVGFGLGTWDTLRKLFPRQKFLLLEENYKVAKNEHVIALLQARLYRAWAEALQRFLQESEEVEVPFRTWVEMAARVKISLEGRQADLSKRLQGQVNTANRYYFNQPDFLDELFRMGLNNETACQAARQLYWTADAHGRWSLHILASDAYAVVSAGTEKTLTDEQAEAVVLELCTWFADSIRQMSVAEVIAQREKPETALENFHERSTALIHYLPEHQPDLQKFRFVCVSTKKQDAYFSQLLDMMQKRTAHQVSQKQVELADPYRAVALSTGDILRRGGLTTWRAYNASYEAGALHQRPGLHVFPAEHNAACLEYALSQLGISRQAQFSPAACLALQDMRRARLFWIAYGLKIVDIQEESIKGSSSLRSYVLKDPGQLGVEYLTEQKDMEPSLWEAVTAYVLGLKGGATQALEQAIQLPADLPVRNRVRQLEDAIDRLAAPLMTDKSTQELGWMMKAFLEDEVRVLEGDKPLLDQDRTDGYVG